MVQLVFNQLLVKVVSLYWAFFRQIRAGHDFLHHLLRSVFFHAEVKLPVHYVRDNISVCILRVFLTLSFRDVRLELFFLLFLFYSPLLLGNWLDSRNKFHRCKRLKPLVLNYGIVYVGELASLVSWLADPLKKLAAEQELFWSLGVRQIWFVGLDVGKSRPPTAYLVDWKMNSNTKLTHLLPLIWVLV